jgi:plastocyanin
MKSKIILLVAFCCIAPELHAGTITGTVRAEGKKEITQQGGGGKYDSRKFKFAEKVNYNELTDFIIYVIGKPTNAPVPPAKPIQVITQRDATFRPHVLPVVVGTAVEWPNKDNIFHNVFSMSDAAQFDLGLYKDPDLPKPVVFDKSGRVDVFCSIHSKMSCVVLVLENPWFAAADQNGKYKIENVPAGTYKLKAWHERVPASVQEVVVPAEGEVKVDFTLGIKGLPKY